jgi:RNA polymerase sigma-70 factor (ECF subfamily)
MGRDRSEPVAELPDSPIVADSPEQRLLAAERDDQLGRLLAHLNPRQREVLVLRLAVGLSAEETAQAVGATAVAVRVSQHRALLRLRRIIQQGDSAAEVLSDRAAPVSGQPCPLAGSGVGEVGPSAHRTGRATSRGRPIA